MGSALPGHRCLGRQEPPGVLGQQTRTPRPWARGAAAACCQAPWVAGTRPAHRCGIITRRPAVTTGETPLTASRVFLRSEFLHSGSGQTKKASRAGFRPGKQVLGPGRKPGSGQQGQELPGRPAGPGDARRTRPGDSPWHSSCCSPSAALVLAGRCTPPTSRSPANRTDHWQLSGSPTGWRGPGGAMRALWHKCVCATHATARGGAEAPVQPAPDVNRRHPLAAATPTPSPAQHLGAPGHARGAQLVCGTG